MGNQEVQGLSLLLGPEQAALARVMETVPI